MEEAKRPRISEFASAVEGLATYPYSGIKFAYGTAGFRTKFVFTYSSCRRRQPWCTAPEPHGALISNVAAGRILSNL